MSSQEHVLAFRKAMEDEGVVFKGSLEPDGVLHRVHVEGDRNGSRNGWYVLHLDDGRPAGAFGCKKRMGDDKVKWTAKGLAPMSPEERRALHERAKAAREKRLAEERERQAEAARAALYILENEAGPAPDDHPALKRKGVKSFGLFRADWVKEFKNEETGEIWTTTVRNALLVPIRIGSAIVSLQAIFPDANNKLKRDKDFLRDGRKLGGYFPIGKPTMVGGRRVIVFGEGYSTCASIHMATGLCVIVGFNAGNLPAVVKLFREKVKDALFVIAADNDRWTEQPMKNPGVHYAREAAKVAGGLVAIPEFKALDNKPTDFNDLHMAEGLEEVRRQITAMLQPAPAELPAPTEQPMAIIEPQPAPPPPPLEGPEEGPSDAEGPFRLLGLNRQNYYVYQHARNQVLEYSVGQLNSEATLIELAPINWWEVSFPGEKGLNRRMATNWLVRTCEKRGVFNPDIIRGRGAWYDGGRIVYHFGGALTVDGAVTDVSRIKNSRYIYELSYDLPMPADDPMADSDGDRLIKIAEMFRWQRPASALLLAGWTALAPVCGALKWRPHIWLTGEAGCGKSTILERYVYFLMNDVCMYAQGRSTEAGMRQTLKRDALPVLFEESEGNTEREAIKMEAVLGLVRQASSESRAKTYLGTQGGDAIDFHIRSMFALASIQVSIKQQADRERFAKLSLVKKGGEGSVDRWAKTSVALSDLNADTKLPGRLIRRSLNLLPTTLRNIETFLKVAAQRFGNQRDGDQYGTLLAGAWSLRDSGLVTFAQAEKLIDAYDWDEHLEESETDEPTRCRKAILGAIIQAENGHRLNIYELVSAAAGVPTDTIKMSADKANGTLRRYGMKVVTEPGMPASSGVLLFEYTSAEIPKLIAGTPFATDWRNQLRRSEGARRYEDGSGNRKKTRISGEPADSLSIPLSVVLGDERSEADDEEPF